MARARSGTHFDPQLAAVGESDPATVLALRERRCKRVRARCEVTGTISWPPTPGSAEGVPVGWSTAEEPARGGGLGCHPL